MRKKRSITGVLRTPTPKMLCKSRAVTLLISMTYYITDLLQKDIRATLILLGKIPDGDFGSTLDRCNSLADGIFGQFSDIMNIQLAHYLPAVRFNGFAANMQFEGDFFR